MGSKVETGPKCRDQKVFSPIAWDAQTWLQRRCTRVRRGATQRRARDAADRASVPRRAASATWFLFFSPTRADAAETRPDSRRIGLIRTDLGRIS